MQNTNESIVDKVLGRMNISAKRPQYTVSAWKIPCRVPKGRSSCVECIEALQSVEETFSGLGTALVSVSNGKVTFSIS
jgi:hypothetical protein